MNSIGFTTVRATAQVDIAQDNQHQAHGLHRHIQKVKAVEVVVVVLEAKITKDHLIAVPPPPPLVSV